MFGGRLKKLRITFLSNKIDALLVSSPVNIQYLTGYSNFSRDEREAYLFVTNRNATLFTDARYIEAVQKIIPSSIKATVKKPAYQSINRLVQKTGVKIIGFDKNLTFEEFAKFKKEVGLKFVLSDDLVEKIRQIKDADEIQAMQKAAKLTDKCYSQILNNLRIGITEIEAAWRMEKFIKEHGGTLAFESIVAFGPNSSIPHHMTSDKKLSAKDEFILLDFGAKVKDGYCADMTRTILTKNSSNKAKKMYAAVLEAQKKAAESIAANKKDNAANAAKVANKALKDYGFKPVPHGLGHGVGLEVHEKPHLHPKSADILADGMVFSIEPGIYIPGFGGVRIEDDYLLTKNKLAQLTNSPKNTDEV